MTLWRALLVTTSLTFLGSCTPNSGHLEVALPEETAPRGDWSDVTAVGDVVGGYLKALVAEEAGDTLAAAQAYAQVAAANPDNLDMRQRAFDLLLAAGDLPGAIAQAQTLAAKGEVTSPVAHLLLMLHDVQSGQLPEAQAALAAARAQDLDLLPFELLRAYLSLAQGEPIDSVVEAIQNFPNDEGFEAEKFYHLGRLAEAQNDLDGALQNYAQGFVLNPTYLPIIDRLGAIYRSKGEFAKAVELYTTFDALKPNSGLFEGARLHALQQKPAPVATFTLADNIASVMFSFANLMITEEAFLAAEQFLHLANFARPHDPMTWFYLGVIAEHEGRHQQALDYYAKIPPQSDVIVAAHLRQAQTLSAMGRYAQAVEVLNAMVARGEKPSLARQTIAEIYYNQKDFAQAVTYYNQLLTNLPPELTPREAALFFARGTAHERLGKFREATQDLEKSLSIFPDNPTALNYIGYMLVDQKLDIPKGKEYILRALALKPNDGAIIDSLGWAYYRLKDYPKALGYLEQAANLVPADPTVTDHLGDVYYQLGRLNEAGVQWRRALQQGPENEQIRQQIEQKLQRLQTR